MLSDTHVPPFNTNPKANNSPQDPHLNQLTVYLTSYYQFPSNFRWSRPLIQSLLVQKPLPLSFIHPQRIIWASINKMT